MFYGNCSRVCGQHHGYATCAVSHPGLGFRKPHTCSNALFLPGWNSQLFWNLGPCIFISHWVPQICCSSCQRQVGAQPLAKHLVRIVTDLLNERTGIFSINCAQEIEKGSYQNPEPFCRCPSRGQYGLTKERSCGVVVKAENWVSEETGSRSQPKSTFWGLISSQVAGMNSSLTGDFPNNIWV